MNRIVIEPCIGGCGRVGPVTPRHPAHEGYLCEECRERILAYDNGGDNSPPLVAVVGEG